MSPPDFRSSDVLRQHALWVLSFYGEQALDPSGGMYHHYVADGRVADAHNRHLVSAARFAVACAAGAEMGDATQVARTAHALAFIDQAFHDPSDGGYHWIVDWRDGRATPIDRTRQMYGHAFVMLAAARAVPLAVPGARALLERVFALTEEHFFDPAHGLYADEAQPGWRLDRYRGQNANMHACEAMIAAWQSTQDERYLVRAEQLAHAVTVRLSATTNGDIGEHYTTDWQPDWDYNRHDSSNIYRPWGYQPGHFTEWAKLLLILDAERPAPWRLPRAEALFSRAWAVARDATNGGLHYGFAPDGTICHADKVHWVQTETFAAAALLALATGKTSYWQAYDELWQYAWQHFVDHAHGAWKRQLSPHNVDRAKPGAASKKIDYHAIGCCLDVWRALNRDVVARGSGAVAQ